MQTGLRLTLIRRLSTVVSAESRSTFTGVRPVSVVARRSVLAGIQQCHALVDIVLTQSSCISSVRAVALEDAHAVNAPPIVLAGL